MNCNIIRNNNKNELSQNSTNNKNLLDKNYNRFKYRTSIENNNVSYQSYKYQKFKKFNKRPNESIQTNGESSKLNSSNSLVHDKFESFPMNFVNGGENSQYQPDVNFNPEQIFEINKKKFNVQSSFIAKCDESIVNLSNNNNPSNVYASIIDKKKSVLKDNTVNSSSIDDKLKKSPMQDENTNNIRSEKRKFSQKWNNKKHHEAARFLVKPDDKNLNPNICDKNGTKMKLNFLQESQLTSEQLSSPYKDSKPKSVYVEFVNDNKSRLQKNQINGLNPSAVEFTPCGTKKYNEKSQKFCTESLDSGLKVLNITEVSDAGSHPTISNPMVLDDGSMTMGHNTFGYSSFYDPQFPANVKVTLSDLGLHQNICPFSNMPLARTMPPLNYTPAQTIVPQFQVALYGGANAPHLIRYNQPAQNLPLNLQGSYFLYSPVMINNSSGGSMYNSLLPTNHQNRLFSMDIPTVPGGPFAHHQSFFNSNHTNNGNIFADSISSSTSSTSHLIR